MSSLEPFEYALIRVVPRVERGEAMNAGVILYSQRPSFLGCQIFLNEARLLAQALRQHEPWLEWAGKRDVPGFAVDPVALLRHEHIRIA